MDLIYLATPYNHPDPEVRAQRFNTACLIASHLMRMGIHLFCPIAHTHPISLAGRLPSGWEYWKEYDHVMLRSCSELWVVKMDGWDMSEGIKGEIEIATELGLQIRYVEYEGNEIYFVDGRMVGGSLTITSPLYFPK
jgi:uncharacterized protein DUF1937